MTELGRSEAICERVEANLAETQAVLQVLAGCLREEREMVVLFELEPLLQTIQRKEEALDKLEKLADERRPICEELIELHSLGGEATAGFADFLRAMGEVDEARRERWAKGASELESLRVTVGELQVANESIVRRASKWVNQYLGQLSGADGKEYNARGQLGQSSISTLRRTI